MPPENFRKIRRTFECGWEDLFLSNQNCNKICLFCNIKLEIVRATVPQPVTQTCVWLEGSKRRFAS